jgi:NADPH-dependent curcumin reductase CurA
MSQWLMEGKMQYKEHLVQGMEQTVDSFIGLLEGKNFGKLVIQLNDVE